MNRRLLPSFLMLAGLAVASTASAAATSVPTAELAAPAPPPDPLPAMPPSQPASDGANAAALYERLGYPQAVLDRLSQPQLIELLQTHEKSRNTKFDRSLVSIVVPLSMFTAMLVGLWLGRQGLLKRDQIRHETLRMAIERGVVLPAELLLPPPASSLRRGVLLLFGGVGLLVLLMFGPPSADRGVWTFSMVPICVGAAYLVLWKLGEGRTTRAPEEQPSASRPFAAHSRD